MKGIKYIILTAFVGLIVMGQSQTPSKPYSVLFYNLENLFDTIPGENDSEFTPKGAKAWNSQKYWKKMSNIESVFYEVAKRVKDYPTVIGVSEIENRNVLEDIVVCDKIAKANYQIVHYDSPDLRGVDVAFFYRPDKFKYEGSRPIPVVDPKDPDWKTRDVLMMWGTIENEQFYFFVAHWPSRLGGQAASEPKRMLAAQVTRNVVDSLYRVAPDAKIVIMGDLNDDPTDKAVLKTLGAKIKLKDVGKGDLFNPYGEMLKAGFGTLAYNDMWNIFDNIIVSENLVNAKEGELRLQKATKSKFYGNIFKHPMLIEQSGKFKGYPFRTYVGNNFQGGYSDHLPVFISIAK